MSDLSNYMMKEHETINNYINLYAEKKQERPTDQRKAYPKNKMSKKIFGAFQNNSTCRVREGILNKLAADSQFPGPATSSQRMVDANSDFTDSKQAEGSEIHASSKISEQNRPSEDDYEVPQDLLYVPKIDIDNLLNFNNPFVSNVGSKHQYDGKKPNSYYKKTKMMNNYNPYRQLSPKTPIKGRVEHQKVFLQTKVKYGAFHNNYSFGEGDEGVEGPDFQQKTQLSPISKKINIPKLEVGQIRTTSDDLVCPETSETVKQIARNIENMIMEDKRRDSSLKKN